MVPNLFVGTPHRVEQHVWINFHGPRGQALLGWLSSAIPSDQTAKPPQDSYLRKDDSGDQNHPLDPLNNVNLLFNHRSGRSPGVNVITQPAGRRQ